MKHKITTTATYVLLVGACIVAVKLPKSLSLPSASGQATPNIVTLHGIVRDFLSSHPDFDLPASSFGLTAGSIDTTLGPNGKPDPLNVVESNGSNGMSTANQTLSKWGMDSDDPTKANDNKGGIHGTITGAIKLKGKFGKALYFDGVDDYVEIPHHPSYLVDNATVAFWFKPDNPTGQQGLISKDSSGYDTGGHFSIYVDGSTVEWRLQSTTNSYYLQSPPGSIQADTWYHVAASFGPLGMKFYLDGGLVGENLGYTGGLGSASGGVGNKEPWAMGVMLMQSADLSISGWNKPYAGMIDEFQIFEGEITETDFNTTGGYLVAQTSTNSSGDNIAPSLAGTLTCDNGGTLPACIDPSTDVPAVIGDTDDGGISSIDSFEQWFTDVLGTNMSVRTDIHLVEDAFGVYQYLNNNFYPVDDQVFGNEGELHNNNFTYTLCATFTYEECTGQFFEFEGGDGAWLFVNGQLAIDQSGAGYTTNQLIELDRLCLVDGQTYTMDFFYAQRQSFTSVFRFSTSVLLDSCNKPMPTMGMYD